MTQTLYLRNKLNGDNSEKCGTHLHQFKVLFHQKFSFQRTVYITIQYIQPKVGSPQKVPQIANPQILIIDFRTFRKCSSLRICDLRTGKFKKFADLWLRKEPKNLRICDLRNNKKNVCAHLCVQHCAPMYSYSKPCTALLSCAECPGISALQKQKRIKYSLWMYMYIHLCVPL